MSIIIERINFLIEKNKLNPTSFAKRIDMSQKTVNNYLNGKRKLSLEFICRVLSSFELNFEWLIQSDKGNYSLYHYTSTNGLIGILEDGKIIFSSFLNANDTKERELYRHFIHSDKDTPLGKEIRPKEKAQEELERNYKYIAFCKYESSDRWIQDKNNDYHFLENEFI